MSEIFDDKKLIQLAKFNYFSLPDHAYGSHVSDLFVREKLTNEERNLLLEFLDDTRFNAARPMSIARMKREIFQKIGYTTTNEYDATVNRNDLEAIYTHIIGRTPKKV